MSDQWLTVSELIACLQQLPADAEVWAEGYDQSCMLVTGIAPPAELNDKYEEMRGAVVLRTSTMVDASELYPA